MSMTIFQKPLRAAIYTRISSDRTGEGLGVERQRQDCVALAEREGYEVGDRYYEDNDKSAYSGKPRPAYKKMLEDIKHDIIQVVLVWDADRLHRSPVELEHFMEVCDAAKIDTHTVQSGQMDLSTADGKFKARILGSVARAESDKKSDRLCRKHEELALKGAWGGGSKVFGYRRSKVTTETPRSDGTTNRDARTEIWVDTAEAEVIRQCVRRLLAGESLRSLTKDLIQSGVPTVRGGVWTEVTLRSILAAARNSSQREWTERKVGRSNGFGPIVAQNCNWPSIIKPEETAAVRALLSNPERKTSRAGRHLCTGGLSVCGACGKSLNSRWVHGVRSYACIKNLPKGKCGQMSIIADQTDKIVEGLVLEALVNRTTSAPRDATAGRRRAKSAQELDEARQALQDLAAMYGDRANRMSAAEFMAGRKPLMATIDRLEQASDPSTGSAMVGVPRTRSAIDAWWVDLPLTRRQAVTQALIRAIVVQPVRQRGYSKYDPDRLRIVWRV